MRSARLIICEKSGKWAFALGEIVASPPPEICETRSLAEARARLQESPASVLAMECSAENWLDLCRWLPRQIRDFSRARVVVMADPDMRSVECVLRTAGAHQVVFSLVSLLGMARWIARHFEQVPQPEESDREWTWGRMPWSPR
ncbi:MAG: hypothetical protein JJ992_04295 [Planctomycetes bacterium]|nr:hypothetical protein [Planctomycetota bacterium]